jgi:chemotaxis family two-component system sensor kinase Cph1
MGLSKRAGAAMTVTLGLVLLAVVVRDMYADWALEGKPLWSTTVENGPLIVLICGVLGSGYWVYQHKSLVYMRLVSRWQVIGAVGIGALVSWVVGLQSIQGEFKPVVILVQTTIGGAVAGTVVGYANARTEETLMDAEQQRDRFGALFENIPAEIVDVDLTETGLQVEEANAEFESMFGEAPAGTPLPEAVGHDDEVHEQIRDRVEAGDPLETEVTAATREGQGYFQLRVAPYGDGRAYVIYVDVTEMRIVQKELEETVTQLERSNERLEDFAYIASHDLQEPLRTVSRYADIIVDEYEEDLDETGKEYLDTVVTGAERMSSMINGLLDYSRVTTRGTDFDSVDTESIVEGMISDLDVMCEEEDGTITYDSLPTVSADRDQLWQVFQNLVKNALEHSGDEPVEISITATEDEEHYTFVVEDDGPGIDPYLQDDIFNMSESGENFQTQGEAKGIGLAVVERIINRHGGDIWVESEPGKGSRFLFTIPK